MKKRLGNDLPVEIIVTRNGQPEDFSQVLRMCVVIRSSSGALIPFDYIVNGNVLTGMFWGKDQLESGDYYLELVENPCQRNMATIDAVLVTLVPKSSLEEDDDPALSVELNITDEGITLSDAIGVVRNGLSAYDLAVLDGFEGTVEEWLASLKGEKGDPGMAPEDYEQTKQKVRDLEDDKADDSNVVHKTSNETINGTKTFNSHPVLSGIQDFSGQSITFDAETVSLDGITGPMYIGNVRDGVYDTDAVNKRQLNSAVNGVAHLAGAETFTGFKQFAEGIYSEAVIGANAKIMLDTMPGGYVGVYDDGDEPIPFDVGNPTDTRHAATKDYVDSHHDTTKQDVISDLASIRSGAALGATALQNVPSTYRTAIDQDAIDATKADASALSALAGRVDALVVIDNEMV